MGAPAEKIKAGVDLVAHIKATFDFKKEYRHNGEMRFNPCPFCAHDDCFDATSRIFSCFSCGKKGSVIDFEIERGAVATPGEAIFALAKQYNIDLPQTPQTSTGPAKTPKQIIAKLLADTRTITNQDIDNYLIQRGIEEFERAKRLLKENGVGVQNYWQSDCLIIPLLAVKTLDTAANEIHSLQIIRINGQPFGDLGVNKIFPKSCSGKGVFFFDVGYEKIIIVESFANALCLAAVGLSTICIFSISNLNLVPEIMETFPDKTILMWLDRGVERQQIAACEQNGIDGLWWPENAKNGYDINDVAKENNKTFPLVVQAMLNGAAKRPEWWTENQAPTATKEDNKQAKTTWYTVTKEGKIVIFRGLCAEAYHERQNGNLVFSDLFFWAFSGKAWQIESETKLSSNIRKFIKKNTGGKPITAALINDISQQSAMLAYSDTEFDTHKNLIALQNCVLDTDTGERFNHNKDYYQTIILPFDYVPDALPSEWLRFLKELEFKRNTILRLQEWFGYCLFADARIEKCLFLWGEGSNGKGVVLETLAKMLGDNSCAIEPQELMERFQLLRLRGKLVNCCSDISTQKVFGERFKNIVSGELVESDVKHKDSVKFRPFAKHLFSANNLIVTKDRSYGFFRRFDVLYFHKIFDEQTRDEGLKERIWASELPGVFNWALDGLQRLRKNNWKFTASEEFQAAHDDFRRDTNPIALYLAEQCINLFVNMEQRQIPPNEKEDFLRTQSVRTDHFRQDYIVWCEKNGYKALSEVNLGKEVARLGYQKKRIMSASKRFHLYYGLSMDTSKLLPPQDDP